MKLSFLIFALADGVSTVAVAQIPRYDVEDHCTEIASLGDTYSNSLFNSCIELEQASYDNLKRRWDSIPQTIKSHCGEISIIGGNGSYSLFESCIEIEESAGSQPKTFKY